MTTQEPTPEAIDAWRREQAGRGLDANTHVGALGVLQNYRRLVREDVLPPAEPDQDTLDLKELAKHFGTVGGFSLAKQALAEIKARVRKEAIEGAPPRIVKSWSVDWGEPRTMPNFTAKTAGSSDGALLLARKLFAEHHRAGRFDLYLDGIMHKDGAAEEQIISGAFDTHGSLLLLLAGIRAGIEATAPLVSADQPAGEEVIGNFLPVWAQGEATRLTQREPPPKHGVHDASKSYYALARVIAKHARPGSKLGDVVWAETWPLT